MRLAAPGDAEVEAWLPLADAVALPPDASVRLYLNASPLSPVTAQLRYMAHDGFHPGPLAYEAWAGALAAQILARQNRLGSLPQHVE